MRFLLTVAALFPVALAHEEEVHETATETFFHQYPQLDVALYGLFALILLSLFTIYFGKKFHKTEKKIVFAVFALVSVFVTGYLIVSTVQLNILSETGGPVHWHADFEIFACGEKLALKESGGLEGKIGTEVLHHHNDYRIHVEGVLVRKSDASLGKFFESISGKFTENEITVILNDGTRKTWRNGDRCPDGKEGKIMLYVNGKPNFAYDKYIIAPYSNVPPGDVLKIVFG